MNIFYAKSKEFILNNVVSWHRLKLLSRFYKYSVAKQNPVCSLQNITYLYACLGHHILSVSPPSDLNSLRWKEISLNIQGEYERNKEHKPAMKAENVSQHPNSI